MFVIKNISDSLVSKSYIFVSDYYLKTGFASAIILTIGGYMGIIYLFLSKISAIGKMVAMKKCGNIAKGSKNSLAINFIRSVGCIPVALILCLFTGFQSMSTAGLIICIISGIANAGLLFSWVLCAERSSLCTVEIFCMIGGVVLPMIISPLLFEGEIITFTQWIGSILLLPAAFLFSKKERTDTAKMTPLGLALLLVACLSNALCVLTQKLFTTKNCGSAADFNLLTFVFCSIAIGMAYFLLLAFKKKETKAQTHKLLSKKQFIVYIFVAIVMLYASQYFSTLASGNLASAYFFPLSYAIGMPLTLATDIFIFKEKLRVGSVIGLALVILSVLLIGIKL